MGKIPISTTELNTNEITLINVPDDDDRNSDSEKSSSSSSVEMLKSLSVEKTISREILHMRDSVEHFVVYSKLNVETCSEIKTSARKIQTFRLQNGDQFEGCFACYFPIVVFGFLSKIC